MFEMAEYLKTIPAWGLIAIILVMAYILHGYWNDRKGELDRREEALKTNTEAIMKLQFQIEQLTDLLAIVPKMKVDIDWAFEKIRDLEERT